MRNIDVMMKQDGIAVGVMPDLIAEYHHFCQVRRLNPAN